MHRFLLAVIAATPILTSANEEVIKCNPGGTQSEMNVCANEIFAIADKELNDTYKSLIKKEADNPQFISKLKLAQQAWIKFRDADLDARFSCQEMNMHICWGTMYYTLHLNRKTLLTRERTAHLRQILNDGLGE